MSDKLLTNEETHALLHPMKIHCSYDKIVKIEDLKPHPKNPNTHSEEQIERLAEIIKYQGIRRPVRVSALSGYITAGHGLVEALRVLNQPEAPVNYQEYESEEQEYADIVADNSIASWADLNLSLINAEIPNLGPDFDINMLGLKDFEIEPADKYDKYADKDADEVPEVKDVFVKRNDLWSLGRHRLCCGDANSHEDVLKLMNGEKADMVFTDPPYNVQFNGRTDKFDVIVNDDLDEQDFENLIQASCEMILSLNPDHYYIWCNWKFYSALQTKLPFKACIVWAKNNFGLGVGYRHQHEFCLFSGIVDDNVTNESDLWEVAKDREYQHPTQKPVELSRRALKNHRRANNVVDLFAGSGSTFIGCEQTGRRCFGMEIDPHYCSIIITRWEKFTGLKAVKMEGECQKQVERSGSPQRASLRKSKPIRRASSKKSK
jgi:DNA modification methylase